MNDAIFKELLAALGVLTLDLREGGNFGISGAAPAWLQRFAVLIEPSCADPLERFAFLEDFVADARRLWDAGGSGTFHSGVWAETDDRGVDLHLQATAMTLASQHLLLIAPADGNFDERQSLIQKARETRLGLQTELTQQRQVINRVNEESIAKSRFLANMSHELRTPLGAILGYCELMQDDARIAGHTQYLDDLQKIRDSGNHLLNLINAILDLSKIGAGKMQLYLQPVAIAGMVNDVVAVIAPSLQKNGNTLSVTCPAHLGQIVGDELKLRQCLLNLLSNAAKFTRQGQVSLTVSRDTLGSPKWLRFSVSDTGIGMTPEQIADSLKPSARPTTQSPAITEAPAWGWR